jgi:regulator of protease activity HflC (stomatin/prohibitin superfamily)
LKIHDNNQTGSIGSFPKKAIFSLASVLIAVLLTLTVACGCVTRIGPGHVGIEVNAAGSNKGVQAQTARTGWFFYNPLNTTVIEYQTAQRLEKWTASTTEGKPVNEEVSFTNKDSMVINADVAIAFSLDPDKVPYFYTKFLAKGEDDLDVKFTNGYLKNQVRNCLNELAGNYDIKSIMGDNAEFLNKTKKCIQDDVSQYGVQIDQFGLIGAPRPPQTVIDSINAKAKAEQVVAQTQIEIAQTEAQAKKQVAEAEGNAKSHIAQAEGDAVYRIKIAQAEADANKLLSSSLTAQLLEWRKLQIQSEAIQRWNGQRPQVEGSGSGLLLNVAPKQ